MAKVKVKNISPVPLKTFKAGAIFKIEMGDDGLPADSYWRRRLDEGVIQIMGAQSDAVAEAPSEPDPVPEPTPAPPPPSAAPVARAVRSAAAASQKE
jgi:hypothetical protein